MNYRQAKKITIGTVLEPKMYNWDFIFSGGTFRKRKGEVERIEEKTEEYGTKKKIIFYFKDGRSFEHDEIEKVVT